MPQKVKKKLHDGLDDIDSDLDSPHGNDSSESTLPTDPTFAGVALAGLSILDVCRVYFTNLFVDFPVKRKRTR